MLDQVQSQHDALATSVIAGEVLNTNDLYLLAVKKQYRRLDLGYIEHEQFLYGRRFGGYERFGIYSYLHLQGTRHRYVFIYVMS
jgi:hypothetical protein